MKKMLRSLLYSLSLTETSGLLLSWLERISEELMEWNGIIYIIVIFFPGNIMIFFGISLSDATG